MPLTQYRRKRSFKKTPEPRGGRSALGKQLQFVVHKHRARNLHYDLRVELDGVLKSWAVPKGPPPQGGRHLAVMVEDHPYAYKDFKGTIPKGEYGAGTVEIYDRGTYRVLGAKTKAQAQRQMRAGLRRGHATFILAGKKLKGEYALIKFRPPRNWLFIKAKKKL
jgi:bifunctional non-homologous end joining protein LigD